MRIGPKLAVLSLVLVATAMLAQGLAHQSGKASPEAKKRYAEAQKLLSVGEKEKAIEELKAIIQLAPEYVEAHRDFLDNQRDKAESFIEQYEGYVKANPDSAIYHYLLGKAYSNANKRDKADAELKKALELDPEFGWAALAVSTVESRAGNRDRSVELLEKASKHAGENTTLRSAIATNFISKKLYEQALREAERILQTDPNHFNAYTTRWQCRMNITLGADETRAEVLREVRELEEKHKGDILALLAVQRGYQMLEDQEGIARAKKAILAIDPKHFERQSFSFSMMTPSGKMIRLSGSNARLLSETYSMKDEKQKLETYKKLEKDIEDAEARLYTVYPGMLRSYVALKDLDNAEKVLSRIVKANMEPRDLIGLRIMLARAYVESKSGLDTALEHARYVIEQLRTPPEIKPGSSPESAEYLKENARNQLASALHLQGQALLEKGKHREAAESLSESVQLDAQEASLYDLGLAYVKMNEREKAIEMLSKAYAFEGKRQQEAKANLQKIYGSRSQPLADFLKAAVERRRAEVLDAAINKALREIAKTEPKEAPAFALMTLSGQKVQLADLRGKVLLLNFWATW
ncbi:MAG TPA: hypothetical protein VNO14_19370 [Blastocatellia bacterium]|nr:hypothetical protein [Blastocatellia bacterium]